MILGILVIILIAQKFFILAGEYKRNKWIYAIIGVATYYIGTFIAAFIYGAIYFVMDPEASDESVDTFLSGLILVGFGLLSCALLYNIFKRNWERAKRMKEKDRIHEIGTKDSIEE
ncbi:hypothetical protein RQM59_12000 [Flavobacteriaceae bacterium S356]|uniref:Uncharacterized protein n=1 Tax=Asprobacillus argus TaxID=3076534 RepID=A0ABU3LIR2_9FLAO|nr:hypothetical protein [Flavobacteriaceae bacterium S356]